MMMIMIFRILIIDTMDTTDTMERNLFLCAVRIIDNGHCEYINNIYIYIIFINNYKKYYNLN